MVAGQTVNLVPLGSVGSNPTLPTMFVIEKFLNQNSRKPRKSKASAVFHSRRWDLKFTTKSKTLEKKGVLAPHLSLGTIREHLQSSLIIHFLTLLMAMPQGVFYVYILSSFL